jgi:hypothetical protein
LIPQTERAKLHFQFPATLDTPLKRSYRETSSIAKILLLTSKHFVLTDSLLIDSKGLRKLLQNEHFLRCLDDSPLDDLPPIVASMRGEEGFEAVLRDWFVERESPQVLASLSQAQNEKIQKLYGNRKTKKPKTLGHFYDICKQGGEDFPLYLRKLEGIFQPKARFKSTWPRGDYQNAVSRALASRREALEKHLMVLTKSNMPEADVGRTTAELRLCNQLIKELEKKGGVDRGYCSSLVNSSDAPPSVKQLVKREVLENTYNDRFAEWNECDLIRGDECARNTFLEGAPDLATQIQNLQGVSLQELKVFPIVLEDIPFGVIANIRRSPTFQHCMTLLGNQDVQKRLSFLPDYLNFLSGEFTQVPTGVARIKLQIRRYVLGEKIQFDFENQGISARSALTWMAKGGSWLVSQAGIPVAGKVGDIIAYTVEKCFDKRRDDQEILFKHTLALRALAPERAGIQRQD